MRVFFAALLFPLVAVAAVDSPSSEALIGQQVALINERLAAWREADPAPSQRRLRFAYFLPSDREPAPDFRARLTRAIDETRAFYSRQIGSFRLKANPLAVDRDADGLLRFIIVRGKEPWAAYNSKKPFAGEKVREECLPVLKAAGIDPQRETIAVFTAIMEWDGDKRRFRQKSPYQGGGTVRSGFCWQIDAPPLDPAHIPALQPMIDDGEYGMVSIGKWNSLFVGGIIHELGHAFGLAHNAQRPAQSGTLGTSLMGSGNRTFGDERRQEGRGTFLTLADAVQLVSHPLFSGSEKGLWADDAAAGAFENLQARAERGALKIEGRVSSAAPCYAVIAYTDGEGGGDYDSIATVAVPEAAGRFELRCDDLPKGKSCALRLRAMLANGLALHRGGMSFSIRQDGVIEMEELRQTLVLAPILAALRQGRHDRAEALTRSLPDDEPAKKLSLPMLTPPAQRAETSAASEVSLCDLRPSSATVGWRRPAFDYSPEDLLIRVGGMHVPRAIYAHAPSSYTWQLDGSWKTFSARCALRDDYDGSVEFIVKLNGIEKWRSGVMGKGKSKTTTLDLAGAKSLELDVTNGGDDLHQDHGVWIAPVLRK